MLFDFMFMAPHSERKVDSYDKDGLFVDTCQVNDSTKEYETAVEHPNYNEGKIVIVELYDTSEQAQQGHNKWVKKMTAKKLPKTLKDVSTAEVALLQDSLGKNWRNRKEAK